MTDHLHDTLRGFLDLCDAAALANVQNRNGGPFAAAVYLQDFGDGTWQNIAGPCGNAVLKTALPTAHAEDQAIAPAHQEKLRDALRGTGSERANLYLVCNAEPCPACHAKLEILARNLLQDGLLLPGRFTVVYGASYEETRDVAGFDDGAYQRDFLTPPGTGMIRCREMALADIPENVRAALRNARAAVQAGDRIAAGDGPGAEVAAIQNLCRMQQAAADPTPWDLRGASLYTTAQTIGPLAYAEAQWANVTHWIRITDAPLTHEMPEDAPGIGNAALFRVIGTRPYTHPDSALRFLHLTPFANRAQQEWARLVEAGQVRLYNGV